MTRLSEIPVRVAVGYVVPPDRWVDRSADIYASDINAWIEVHVEGQGWMPVDVTPDRDRQPEEVEEDNDTAGAPFAEPPKSPPLPEDETPPEVEEPEEPEDEEEEEEPEEEEQIAGGLTVASAVLAAASTGLIVLVLIALAVVGYKMWRRRRRRHAEAPAERIAGAWAELVDRVDEAGGGLPDRATPAEAARYAQAIDVLAQPDVSARVALLADQVSIAAFHPLPPSDATAEVAWKNYDELANAINGGAGTVQRMRRAIDPRTLRSESMAHAR